MSPEAPPADAGEGAAVAHAAAQAAASLRALAAAGDALDVAHASLVCGALQDALLSGEGLGDLEGQARGSGGGTVLPVPSEPQPHV